MKRILLLLTCLSLFCMNIVQGDCVFARKHYSGVVLSHKQTAPYPFQAPCNFFISKPIIQVWDADTWSYIRYKGYVTPESNCIGFACNELKEGDVIEFDTDVKMQDGVEIPKGVLVNVEKSLWQ